MFLIDLAPMNLRIGNHKHKYSKRARHVKSGYRIIAYAFDLSVISISIFST